MDKELLTSGIKKGFTAFFWMARIVVPVSYITLLLSWLGILDKVTMLLSPFMSYLGLPAIAAVPLIAGALSSVYAGIAAMSVLPFTKEQMILMANFILICHNMIQETIIQAHSGIKAWKAIAVRILAAIFTVYILKIFLVDSTQGMVIENTTLNSDMNFWDMNISWMYSTGALILKIFLIIMLIMIFLEIAKAKRWTDYICKILRPFLRIMGLSEKVSFLWMTAVVFGLAYGGAVIVEEAKNQPIDKEELEALQLSVGINHSMVEDPALFLPLGLPPLYLWGPRIITAMIATRLLNLSLRLHRYKYR